MALTDATKFNVPHIYYSRRSVRVVNSQFSSPELHVFFNCVSWLFFFCQISACKFMHVYFCFTSLIGWHATSWSYFWFKVVEKSLCALTLETKGRTTEYKFSRQMQGVQGWIGPLLFSSLIAVWFLFPVSVLFCITFHPLNDRHFKVFQVSATECSKCSVVLLFRP